MPRDDSSINDAIGALQKRLAAAGDPIEQLFSAARLCAWGETEVFRSWPSLIGSPAASELHPRLGALCLALLRRLRSQDGATLAATLIECQDVCSLLTADRVHGRLLQQLHDLLAGVVHECDSVLLDDEAAELLHEFTQSQHLDLLPAEWVLGSVRHPLGATARMELARVAGSCTPPVREVCAVPSFEGELVFDGGRPSTRMMSSFGKRRGMILCSDGSKAVVRAVLESDWRISVEFDADLVWCGRIDRVRLGALPAEALDEDRDTWVASLSEYGLDTQTKLVGQPIMVCLSNGERFSM
ncbi:MAG: hypothetical protein CBC35_11945 [Planctomycetes bacterium TMED75]|nr:hypothetical protein [Planctomycetaceae bacterium]OUU90441.1 MAG: hypothetical protein CBC35_11945 [Planctomycetes bacterium TMED75]